jgi:hypothetical protein
MASVSAELPSGFSPQTDGLSAFRALVEHPPFEIVHPFQSKPDEAQAILGQSYDKRYTPSTFIEEVGNRFRVGWFDKERRHIKHFDTLPEAVTDYLLLSFGKGRLRADRPAI